MTEKRFTVHIRWFNYDKTEGDIELKDNGQPILMSESIDDVQWIKTLLNELHEENEQLKTTIQQLRTDNTQQKKLLNKTMKQNHHIKTTIKTMMENERTELGQSVLKQLWEQIE